jgi:hypothetical protein
MEESVMMHITGMMEDSLFKASYNDFSHKWDVVTADAVTGNEYKFEADVLQMAAIFSLMFTGGDALRTDVEEMFYRIAEPIMPRVEHEDGDFTTIVDGRRLIP